MTKAKIRITDDIRLREELDLEYESASQFQLCRYALLLAEHILRIINYPDRDNAEIKEGFCVNELWQKGQRSTQQVRQASLKIHQLARSSGDVVVSSALRVVGHAVATGHMREHAMVASDYAVKVIGLMYPDKMEEIMKERKWQINCLREIQSTE